MSMPIPATNRKFATKTFAVVTPLHSIRLRERVVSVVAKAPMARAVYSKKLAIFFYCYVFSGVEVGRTADEGRGVGTRVLTSPYCTVAGLWSSTSKSVHCPPVVISDFPDMIFLVFDAVGSMFDG